MSAKGLAAALAAFSVCVAGAADGVWMAGSGNWTNAANWAGGAVPVTGDTASFTNAAGGTITVPNGYAFSLAGLYFNTNGANVQWTLRNETNTLVSPAVVCIATNNLFLYTVLKGSDGFQKTGGGTLVLTNSNTQLSGSVKILGGRVLATADDNFGQVPATYQADALVLDNAGFGNNDPSFTVSETRGVTVGANGVYLFGRNSNSTIIGAPVVGPGAVYVNMQSGAVVLNNTNNAYTGNTVVGASGPGYFSTANNAVLVLGRDEVLPHGTGFGALIIDGLQKGLLDLNGHTETVNRVTGFLGASITNGSARAGLLRAGVDNGDMSYAGALLAGVTLAKAGSGTLTYSNTAASAGSLRAEAGTVKVGSAQALGSVPVTLAGGQLATTAPGTAPQRFAAPLLLAQDGTFDRSAASAPIIWSSDLSATADAAGVPRLTVSGGTEPFAFGATNRAYLFNADVSAANGVLFRDRSWLYRLPSSSAWSIASGADVAIGSPGLLGSGPMTLSSYSVRLTAPDSLGSGGEAVTVGGTSNTVWFETTRFATTSVSNDPAYAFTAANGVSLAGTAAGVGFDGAGTVTYAGAVSGSGSLTKNGTGDAVLTAASSFSGSVRINAGRLLVSDDNQLGDGANPIVLSGGTLAFTGSSPLTIARGFTGSTGSLSVASGGLTLTGTASGAITKRGVGTLTLGGSADGSTLDLYVAEGTALLGKSGVAAVRNITGVDAGATARLTGSGGNLVAGGATLTGGTLDLNGQSEALGSLSSTSLASVVRSDAAATLTVGDGNVPCTYYGALAGSGLGLTKVGTNLFVLAGASGAQTAGGQARVEGGTLAWGTGVRYVRVWPGVTRGTNTMPAMGEFQLTLKGRPIAWPTNVTVTATSQGVNGATNLVDNSSRSYWIATATPVSATVDLKASVPCDGYRWYTGSADSSNDPLSWRIEVSADNAAWFTADAKTNQTVTTTRCALVGAYAFGNAWPCDAVAASAGAYVASGAVLRVSLPSESLAALTGSGELSLTDGATLGVGTLSGFAGSVSGGGRLMLGGAASLRTASASVAATVANGGASPASVTVGEAGDAQFGAALADGAAALGLTKRGSGALTLADAGSTYTGDTRVEQGTLVVQAPRWRFRYLRFSPTMTMSGNKVNNGYIFAISEFQLMSNGVVVAFPAGSTATTPYANWSTGTLATNAINGSITERWLSSVIPNPVTIDMKQEVAFDGYRLYNSGYNTTDNAERTPTAWTLEGSSDGAAWVMLCSESGVVPPAPYGSSNQPGKEIGTFSARPPRFKLPLDCSVLSTNALALKLDAVTARYLRFTVTDTRYTSADLGNSGFQLCELQLMRGGAALLYPAGTTATAPADGYNVSGTYFPPIRAVDNVLTAGSNNTNRWYSDAMVNPLTVDMGQQVTFDGYRWYTGPNGAGRDPLGWKLEVSNNATNWYVVDVRTNQTITTDRNAAVGPWSLDVPAGQSAADAIPDVSRTYVASGATLRLMAAGETVGPLSGEGTVSLGGTAFGINGFADAAYAGGIVGTGTVTKSSAAAQTLSGALAYSGTLVVEAGLLDLTGATLTGVTNIVLRGGALTGAATVNGNLALSCEGGVYRANLSVSGALAVTGALTLGLAEGTALPYGQRLFSFGSADAATRAVLGAAVTQNVPRGYVASVHVTGTTVSWTVSAPGTVFLLR